MHLKVVSVDRPRLEATPITHLAADAELFSVSRIFTGVIHSSEVNSQPSLIFGLDIEPSCARVSVSSVRRSFNGAASGFDRAVSVSKIPQLCEEEGALLVRLSDYFWGRDLETLMHTVIHVSVVEFPCIQWVNKCFQLRRVQPVQLDVRSNYWAFSITGKQLKIMVYSLRIVRHEIYGRKVAPAVWLANSQYESVHIVIVLTIYKFCSVPNFRLSREVNLVRNFKNLIVAKSCINVTNIGWVWTIEPNLNSITRFFEHFDNLRIKPFVLDLFIVYIKIPFMRK